MATNISELLQALSDGAEGYATAANSVKDSELKLLFQGFSAERHQMVEELSVFAEESASEETTLVGSVHRGWINLKGAITAGDDYAILAECERGEDHAVAIFNKAIDEPPSAEAAQVIGSMYIRILAVHNEIKKLRDEAKALEAPE